MDVGHLPVLELWVLDVVQFDTDCFDGIWYRNAGEQCWNIVSVPAAPLDFWSCPQNMPCPWCGVLICPPGGQECERVRNLGLKKNTRSIRKIATSEKTKTLKGNKHYYSSWQSPATIFKLWYTIVPVKRNILRRQKIPECGTVSKYPALHS